MNTRIKNISFGELTYKAVKMVLEGTPVGMAVAVLSHTNKLTPVQALELKEAVISNLR